MMCVCVYYMYYSLSVVKLESSKFTMITCGISSRPPPQISCFIPTCFLHHAGITFMYCILQLGVWWLLHTSALLWKVTFPFHARSYDKSGKTKYVHLVGAIIGFLAPLTSVIALMADYSREVRSNADLQAANVTFLSGGLGFTVNRFPPILCTGFSSGVIYYSSILPIIIIFYVGITELILLFAVIHRVRNGNGTERQTCQPLLCKCLNSSPVET